jgi:UDP-glucose 4-epimerase
MSSILVTGSEGFIGRRTVKELRKAGHRVLTVDLTPGSENHLQADFRSKELKSLLESERPEAVVHLAAQIVVTDSIENPVHDLEVNGIGTLNLVRHAIDFGCKNFININSGGAIYDASQPLPFKECAREEPQSPYGLSKSLAEGYVRIYSNKAGINWTSLALSNCFGPVTEHGKGVIFQFWKAINEDLSPDIYGEDVTRDFVFVDDVVRAIELALDKPTNCRVNIGSGREVTLLEAFTQISQVMGSGVEPNILPARFGEIKSSCLDIQLAKSKLNWEPRFTFEEGIEASIAQGNEVKKS